MYNEMEQKDLLKLPRTQVYYIKKLISCFIIWGPTMMATWTECVFGNCYKNVYLFHGLSVSSLQEWGSNVQDLLQSPLTLTVYVYNKQTHKDVHV